VSTNISGNPSAPYLEPGTRALLVAGDRRFLVALLSVQGEVLRLSFPMRDFPVDGMSVTLEFHEETGYAAYECEVIETPKEVGDGLRLRLLGSNAYESRHRGAWRVPAALPLSVKSHIHPRRHAGIAENVSAHGMLMATSAQFEPGENFDFTITLQDDEVHAGIGQIMHVAPGGVTQDGNLYGVRFVGADPALLQAISRFVWRHVRQTYGGEGKPRGAV
jgi:hypothetical protein